MARFLSSLACVALGAALVLAGASVFSADRTRAPSADFELDDGSFEVLRPGASHSVAFVWTRPGTNGAPIETWALFRQGTTEGWLFPGASNPDVSVRFKLRENVQHANLAAFLTWCEDQYPASMNVDKSIDFAVHEHVVTIK